MPAAYHQPYVPDPVHQPAKKLLCPRCKLELIADPNSKHMHDINCDNCDKHTNKVLSCRPCDYDVCIKCAEKLLKK